MRRTLAVWAVVVLAVLLLATPGLVAAKGGHGGGPGGASFNVYGQITGLDQVAKIIYLGDITVYTTADTHYKQCDGVGDQAGDSFRIDFEDLVVGRYARIKGVVESGEYTASVVIQYYDPEE